MDPTMMAPGGAQAPAVDPQALMQAYMQVPRAQRAAFIDAVGPDIGAILKAAARPEMHGLIDRLVQSTGDQAQPGPNDMAETETMTPAQEQGAVIEQMKRGMLPSGPGRGRPGQTVMAPTDADMVAAMMERAERTPPTFG